MTRRFDDLLLFLGRLAYAFLFIPNGLRQLEGFGRFSASLAREGFPFPDVVAALALVAELLGPVLLLLGYEIWLGTILLALFCLAANFTGHRFWQADPAQQGPVLLQFYKNLALIGGLMFLYVSGPGRWSLEGRIPGLMRRAGKQT